MSENLTVLRSPIISVLGHVDHGKTSLLDKIRGTAIAAKEAGGITQHIGATEIPIEVVKEVSGKLLDKFKFDLKIPGLLFIDTPGHEAFTNLRKRGGSIADLAIIVIDVNEGFMPQTYESIEICKQFKVPFIVAANKIDKIPGWVISEGSPFLESINYQKERTIAILEEKIYNIIASLYELGFEAERFDRVSDFTRQVAIIPVSAKTGEGIPELLLLVSGIAQKFLEKRLKINVEGPGKGVVLEKKEIKGLGSVIDVILYDGIIKKGDHIVLLGKNGIITTKIRALLKPVPLKEIRDKATRFKEVENVHAAAGIRISAPNLDDALAGSPIFVYYNERDLVEIKSSLEKEMKEFIIDEDKIGFIVKADTLGTLEAIVRMLKDKNFPIRHADIGNVSKRDVMLAVSNKEIDILYGIILAFNVDIDDDAKKLAKENDIEIVNEKVIYRLFEKLEEWVEKVEELKKRQIFEKLVPPVKIRILPGYVFRRNNPAIVGIEVLSGKLKTGIQFLRKDGRVVGKVKSIQKEGRSVEFAEKGEQVAIAIEGVTIGRQIGEGDVLYSYIPEEHYRTYKDYKGYLTEEEKELLKEIAKIMRSKNPLWGV